MILITGYLLSLQLLSLQSCAANRELAMEKNEVKITNYLSGTSWKVDGAPFADEDRTTYNFYEYEIVNFYDGYGHFIDFDDNHFSSHYSAQCGNDCFTNVNGTYSFLDETTVKITVTEINRRGFCNEETKTGLQIKYNYKIEKTNNGYKLTKE